MKKVNGLKLVLGTILIVFSLLCSQIFCYYIFDEIIKSYTSSKIIFIIPRFIFAIIIYIILELLFIKKKLLKSRRLILYSTYIIFIILLTFKGVPFYSYNLQPFKFMNDLFMYENQLLLFIGNIVLYIPIGWVISKLTVKRNCTIVLLSTVATLFAVEISQYILKLGFFDIDDILLNFMGIMIGYIVYKIFNKNKVSNVEQV